jgi:hypothetical protein
MPDQNKPIPNTEKGSDRDLRPSKQRWMRRESRRRRSIPELLAVAWCARREGIEGRPRINVREGRRPVGESTNLDAFRVLIKSRSNLGVICSSVLAWNASTADDVITSLAA